MKPLELLSPASDKYVAFQAILHGADAVYMGGPSHGARKKAANSIEDIKEVVDFAHKFRAKVYVTVNTVIYESELQAVEQLCRDLYKIGVDAIIVQDMSVLRMDIPPIALHASTQCDTRTIEKALFLQDVGFSQIVLARELSLNEIKDIIDVVNVPVECFVHGALCVSYSGRCGASQITMGRSANRGECAQMCRLPYNLINGRGEIVEFNKYLLSLKDFNTSQNIEDLILAGVSSFKIEGRLKDETYVKNVTLAYRNAIDEVISKYPDKYTRSSFGKTEARFTPDLSKSFNRGFTDYFLKGKIASSMASLKTPKSMGEIIQDINELNNGDGISFFNHKGEYEGVFVNGIENNRIRGSRPFILPKKAIIHRTFDNKWQSLLKGETAKRKIKVDISLDENGISAHDERGCQVRIALDAEKSIARKPMNPKHIFSKLGDTVYKLGKFENNLNSSTFIPASKLTKLRRELINTLDQANLSTYSYDYRRPEKEVSFPYKNLDYQDNVANSLAADFYKQHDVEKILPAFEILKPNRHVEVMTTRYCIRKELGCCLKDSSVSKEKHVKFEGPLTITTGVHKFLLDFDCRNCEMKLIKE